MFGGIWGGVVVLWDCWREWGLEGKRGDRDKRYGTDAYYL